jgi:hypothetical protein
MSAFFAQLAVRVLSGLITALLIELLFKCIKPQVSAVAATC